MWTIQSSINPEKITEIELILLDQEGKKIQATVTSECVDRFSKVLFEGGIYMIVFFRVAENISSCVITFNQFKLSFNPSTIIFQSQSLTIPHYSLTLFTSQRIGNYKNGSTYLIDFVGVITHVYAEPFDNLGQEITNAVRIVLIDKRGTCECVLLGEYVDQFKKMMSESSTKLSILVLQFVKINSKRGIAYLESVKDITKILLNPHMIEVEKLKIDMGYIINSYPLAKREYYSSSKMCKQLEFNGLYPHKTIHEFINSVEDGLFVLCGKMVGLFKVDKWFYPVCFCGAFLNVGNGSYYCGRCHVTVFGGTPKCKVQVGFQDFTSAALFPMLHNLIKEIDCINANGSTFGVSTPEEKVLIDKMVLLIVKKIQKSDDLSDDVVEVLRMTDDPELIMKYQMDGNNFTPAKICFDFNKFDFVYLHSIFPTPSSDLVAQSGEFGIPLSSPPCVDVDKNAFVEDNFQAILDSTASEFHRKYKEFKIRNDRVMSIVGPSGEGSSSNVN
ncbi:replication protein A 70 kDa DNA-binding subunit C [Trifolium repens]|nr:replication protein A 70 kDa DNA-binding subunit C [Trifolium repens]